MICCVCKKECKEVWSYTGYGGEIYKKFADKEFCEKHFLALEKKIKEQLTNPPKKTTMKSKTIKPLW